MSSDLGTPPIPAESDKKPEYCGGIAPVLPNTRLTDSVSGLLASVWTRPFLVSMETLDPGAVTKSARHDSDSGSAR